MAWDPQAWSDRAWTFVGHCRTLPGDVEVAVDIWPPLSEEEADALATQLPLGLPASLRRFLVDGAAYCKCSYVWTPPDSSAIEATIPGETYLYGGPNVIKPTELVELQRTNDGSADTFEEYEPEWESVPQLWRRCTRFLDVRNGDYFGLDTSGSGEDSPVVYLSHDEEESNRVIAPSFESFMETWEQLCYIGPEIWMLAPFLDPVTGYLDATTPKAQQLRSLFGFTP